MSTSNLYALLPPNTIVKYRTVGHKSTMNDVLKDRGWAEGDSEHDWHFLWADPSWVNENMSESGSGGINLSYLAQAAMASSGSSNLGIVRYPSHSAIIDSIADSQSNGFMDGQPFRHVNHFYGTDELVRFDLAVKNFKRMRKVLDREDLLEEAASMDFFLPTFALPADWSAFEQEFRRYNAANMQSGYNLKNLLQIPMSSNLWIMKPPPKALGKGPFLFSKMAQINEWRRDYKFKAAQQEMVATAAALSAAEAAASTAMNSSAQSASVTVASPLSATHTQGPFALRAASRPLPEYPHIVQKYVDSPHLIGGKKYDVCLYVLVTDFSSPNPLRSLPQSGHPDNSPVTDDLQNDNHSASGGGTPRGNPFGNTHSSTDPALAPQGLTIWIHRSGYTRFCSRRFDTNTTELEDTSGHFSNAPPQKTNPRFSPQTGCKWALRSLRQYLCATVGEEQTSRLFEDMQGSVIRALQAVHRLIPSGEYPHRSRSELFSFSFVIQHLSNPSLQEPVLKPILVGIDNAPSFAAETSAEYHLRYNVLWDYLDVIDIEGVRDHDSIRVGGFDLVWRNGPIGITMNDSNATHFHSFIGCSNDLEIPIGRMTLPPKVASGNVERSLT